MALPKFYKVCQDQQGNIVPQVLGSVFNHGTAVLASLYQNDAGTIPLSNPMTSDAQYGSFKFYVNPGHYDLTFTKPGYTFEPIDDMQVPQDVLTLGTMATQNANAVAITGGGGTFSANLVGAERTGNSQYGFVSTLNAAGGTDRFAVKCVGTAPALFHGNVGIGVSNPAAYPLDVTGHVRILSGSLALGTSPTIHKVYVYYDRASVSGLVVQPTADSGVGAAAVFMNAAGGTVGTITTTGAATAYNTSSDVRLKHAIAPLTGSLDVIAALNPISHRWNADDSYAENFLAHELQRVLAYAVSGEPDELNPDGSIKPQQVDVSKCVPRIVGAIKELLARVKTLEQALA